MHNAVRVCLCWFSSRKLESNQTERDWERWITNINTAHSFPLPFSSPRHSVQIAKHPLFAYLQLSRQLLQCESVLVICAWIIAIICKCCTLHCNLNGNENISRTVVIVILAFVRWSAAVMKFTFATHCFAWHPQKLCLINVYETFVERISSWLQNYLRECKTKWMSLSLRCQRLIDVRHEIVCTSSPLFVFLPHMILVCHTLFITSRAYTHALDSLSEMRSQRIHTRTGCDDTESPGVFERYIIYDVSWDPNLIPVRFPFQTKTRSCLHFTRTEAGSVRTYE